MTSLLGIALLALALSGPTVAFISIGGGASTHISITGTALLKKVSETCQRVVEAAGHEFKPTGSSPEELVQACLGPTATGEVSGAKFHSALQEIYMQNALVDRDFVNSAPHHFNSEAFVEGRNLITKGVVAVKASIAEENFKAARETLGRVLHTLQDFYSHSNWVELGNMEPYRNLIIPTLPLENLADANTATCSDCDTGACPNQILPSIMMEKKLTSGYMGVFSADKPAGKCSHGGQGDLTNSVVPRGGINKDERRTDNIALHDAAVQAATEASLQLLEDIRIVIGDDSFLRMMGIARSSVVCFVIDTTGSMSEDIDEARNVVYKIIDSYKGTQDEPSQYILVPFNDPDFGPLVKTTNADVMKREISKLTATGGGDTPEMCLSGVQLALTSAPAYSQIYVFTDAPPKDIYLKDTILALIRSTKSIVSFYETANGRRARRSLETGSFDDYKDLALASGGQAIQVSKSQLPDATDVILDTSTSALVTVLQRTWNPGKQETFPFIVDEFLKNITIYITGTSITYTLTNPAGVSQNHIETSGKLGTLNTVGNLWRIRLNADKQAGTWKINIESYRPYTLKVTGQSAITFIYQFVEKFGGPHPGYAALSGLPQAGQPTTLMLSVMGRKGPSSIAVEDVDLEITSGLETGKRTITDNGDGALLVTVEKVPEGEFVVILTGTDKESNSKFQRQSTTQMSVSKVNIQAVVDSNMEPGVAFELPFSVMTQGSGGLYSFSARNDRNFDMTYPESLNLISGQYTNVTLTITPPADTPSGTDVTLTMEAKSQSGDDSNYAVLRFAVVEKITDFDPPICQDVTVLDSDCPSDVSLCRYFQWELLANVTDGNNTGIEKVFLSQGDGKFSYNSLNASVIETHYKASCCSQIFELVAVDKAGNVGRCYHSIEPSAGPPALTLTVPLWMCLLFSVFELQR